MLALKILCGGWRWGGEKGRTNGCDDDGFHHVGGGGRGWHDAVMEVVGAVGGEEMEREGYGGGTRNLECSPFRDLILDCSSIRGCTLVDEVQGHS